MGGSGDLRRTLGDELERSQEAGTWWPERWTGTAGGIVVFGEGPGVGGSEIRRPRGCKTWKLLQRPFLPELSKHLCA